MADINLPAVLFFFSQEKVVMKVIQFSMYYFNLQVSLFMRLAETSLPTDMTWRWNFWQRRIHAKLIRFDEIEKLDG